MQTLDLSRVIRQLRHVREVQRFERPRQIGAVLNDADLHPVPPADEELLIRDPEYATIEFAVIRTEMKIVSAMK